MTSTFLLFSKLPKNYTKITKRIQIAPRSGAVGTAVVIFVYLFGNFENSKNVDVIFVYFFCNYFVILKNCKNIVFA